jgi:hypothetical protein
VLLCVCVSDGDVETEGVPVELGVRVDNCDWEQLPVTLGLIVCDGVLDRVVDWLGVFEDVRESLSTQDTVWEGVCEGVDCCDRDWDDVVVNVGVADPDRVKEAVTDWVSVGETLEVMVAVTLAVDACEGVSELLVVEVWLDDTAWLCDTLCDGVKACELVWDWLNDRACDCDTEPVLVCVKDDEIETEGVPDTLVDCVWEGVAEIVTVCVIDGDIVVVTELVLVCVNVGEVETVGVPVRLHDCVCDAVVVDVIVKVCDGDGDTVGVEVPELVSDWDEVMVWLIVLEVDGVTELLGVCVAVCEGVADCVGVCRAILLMALLFASEMM